MGRPKGSKDKQPRKNAKPIEGAVKVIDTPEPQNEDLGTFAQSLLADEETRAGIRKRAASGTMTAQEMRAVLAWSLQAPPKVERPSQWKTMAQACNTVEAQLIMNISRRAMQAPELLIYLDGQTKGFTNLEILTGKPWRNAPSEPGKVGQTALVDKGLPQGQNALVAVKEVGQSALVP